MSGPSLVAYQPGIGAVTADWLNTVVQGGVLLSQLRNFPGAWYGQIVFLGGYASPGDGGQGPFWWNPLSTVIDNGTTVIVPNGLTGYGAWLRLIEGGGFYPTTNPGAGSGLIWNNGGFLCVA